MSAGTKKLCGIAVEHGGILGTAAVLKAGGKTWIWLTSDQTDALWREVPKVYEYHFRDPLLSPIQTRYPRFLMGHAADNCGRYATSIGLGEDVFVDAVALWVFLGDTRKYWASLTVRCAIVFDLVEMAAQMGKKEKADAGA